MRLPSELPPSDGGSTPHPIRHLKHILRHQMDHQNFTKLPAYLGGGSTNSTEKLLFLSNSSVSSVAISATPFHRSMSSVAISGTSLNSSMPSVASISGTSFNGSISSVVISGSAGGVGSDRGGAPPLLNICYTTNEVLVIIGVTCFLNFAFILLIMSCVHFFSTRASRLKSAVLVAENGEEYYYEDFQESDDDFIEWKASLDKSFDQENKIDLLQYINNLP